MKKRNQGVESEQKRSFSGRSQARLLPKWIADAKTSVLASFGRGIAADLAAVTAAISEPWSNGQTEGQISRLKLLRRQMYGRGNLDLLRARLLGASDLVLMHGK